MDGWNTTFLLGRPIFRGENVSFRECTEKKRKTGRGLGNDIGRPVVHPQPTKILELLDRLDSRRKTWPHVCLGVVFSWILIIQRFWDQFFLDELKSPPAVDQLMYPLTGCGCPRWLLFCPHRMFVTSASQKYGSKFGNLLQVRMDINKSLRFHHIVCVFKSTTLKWWLNF